MSWITHRERGPRRRGRLARGMNDSQFQAQPAGDPRPRLLPAAGRPVAVAQARRATAPSSASRPRRSTRRGPTPGPTADPWPPDRSSPWSRPACCRARASASCRPAVHVPDDQRGRRRTAGPSVAPRHRRVAAAGVRLRLPARQPGRPRRGRLQGGARRAAEILLKALGLEHAGPAQAGGPLHVAGGDRESHAPAVIDDPRSHGQWCSQTIDRARGRV